MSDRETDLVRLLLIEASRLGSRLFRQNTGHGWIGDATKFTATRTITVNPGDVVIRKARPFHAGFDGLSDIGGFTPRDGVAVYTAIEVKTATRRVTPEQTAFLRVVSGAGGIAGVARSVEDLRRLLEK